MFFFFNDTATTEIYTLSLHDALPIWREAKMRSQSLRHRSAPQSRPRPALSSADTCTRHCGPEHKTADRKSTRLNSSHANISYAVFCLKKKQHRCYNIYLHTWSSCQ